MTTSPFHLVRMSEQTFRRSMDAMLPFFVGLVIGVLSSFATLSGRIATLEADDRVHTTQISALEGIERETNNYVRAIAVKVGVPETQ